MSESHDYIYIADVLRAGDRILFSDLDHLVVWSGGYQANVYVVGGCSVLYLAEDDVFSFGHDLPRHSEQLFQAAQSATESWLEAREAARAELYADFPF